VGDADFLNAAFASGLSEPDMKVWIAITELRVSIADGPNGDACIACFDEHPEDFLGQFMAWRADA
jgi:hypothetical protein